MININNLQAEAMDRAQNDVHDYVGFGAPTNGTSGTGVGLAGPGSTYYDLTNKILYQNVFTKANPVWVPTSLQDAVGAASGTVQNTEYTIATVTIPANFLAAGRGFSIEAWGTLAANANAKNIKLYLGGTAIVSVTGNTGNGTDFYAFGTVLRNGASSQNTQGQISIGAAVTALAVNNAVAETDTSDIIIALKSANTAAAAASATGKGMLVTLNF